MTVSTRKLGEIALCPCMAVAFSGIHHPVCPNGVTFAHDIVIHRRYPTLIGGRFHGNLPFRKCGDAMPSIAAYMLHCRCELPKESIHAGTD